MNNGRSTKRLLALAAALAAVTLGLPVAAPASAAVACVQPIAHRTVHDSTTDEDSILGIQKAALYAGWAELDIHLSKDNQLIVIHDSGVARVSDGVGKVRDLTLAQIKTFHLDITGAQIPTFEEAVTAAAAAGVTLAAELKQRPQWTPPQFKEAERIATTLGATVYLGGYRGFEFDIPRLAPSALTYWRPLPGDLPATPQKAALRSADMVMQQIRDYTPTGVTALENAGYITAAGLTSDFAGAQALGIDYALTNTWAKAITYCKTH